MEWISVKDKLPEPSSSLNGPYYFLWPHLCAARYSKLMGGFVHVGYGANGKEHKLNPTHWSKIQPPQNG